METPDLVKILAQQTEQKGSSQPNLNDFAQAAEEPKPNNNDFDPPPQEKPDFTQFTEAAPNPNLTKKGREKLSSEEYRRMARNFLGIPEGFNVFVMPLLYQKAIFTKAELPRVKELANRQKFNGSSETEYTEEDLKLLQKIEAFKEAKEALPFRDDEIKVLEETLGGLFEKYDWRVNKETEAISVIAMAFLPRVLPLFNKLTVL